MVAPRSCPNAEFVSVNEAAAVVGRSRRTIYKWITDGLIQTRRVAGGPLQVRVSSLFQDEAPEPDPVADVPAAPAIAGEAEPSTAGTAQAKGTSATAINGEALEFDDSDDDLVDVE